MDSITIINGLPKDGKLMIPDSIDIDKTIELYEIMSNKNITDSELYRLISFNYDNLGFLIKLIPIPRLIRLYNTNGLFRPYLTEQLVNDLIKKNDKDIYYSILNKTNVRIHLIDVTNHLNHLYNFRPSIINERLNEFNKYIKCIDLSQFYLGSSLVLYLASVNQKNIDVNNAIFTVYAKTKYVRFANPDNIYLDKETETIYYKLENGAFLTFKNNVFGSIEHVLYTGCQAVYDNSKILMKPKLYQELSSLQNFVKFDGDITKFKKINQNATRYVIKGEFKIKKKTKQCYDCKKGYNMTFILSGYPDLCFACGIKNYKKKNTPVNLSNMTAYVSGARHKIGFETVLMLLRYGAKVIASTRFPNAAWYNYKGEPDFENWKDRLEIIRCDFTQINEVSFLIDHLKKSKINILINNACQTVKSTDLYLQKALQLETILGGDSKYANKMIENVNMTTQITTIDNQQFIIKSPQWTDLAIVSEQISNADIKLNQFKDIEDLTMKDNSTWYKTMDEVGMAEILQVNAINQVVPTMLVNQLKPVMEYPKFIINVTAVEGQFQSNKINGHHPHTNMCKAGINMMVRTMGTEKEKDFYIYAVDPGYVSGVDPFKDKYPLKPIDGASRILDPVIRWIKNDPIESGVKLKDFKISPW